MIELRHVKKKYGDKYALDDLSFTINKGEIVGLIGANGAGKSTTMNIITGFIEQTSGDVIVNGYDTLRHPKKAKQCIGYMPEGVPLYMELTVTEFVSYMARLHGVKNKDIKRVVEKCLNDVGALDVKGKLCRNLSKGYKQRVALAAAISGNPEILILDEPTVGLDPAQIVEIRKLIKDIGKNNTVIISSHILSEISQICDKVIVINNGKLVTIDTPENIENYERQQNFMIRLYDKENKLEEILDNLVYVSNYRIKQNEDETKSVIIEPNDDKDAKNKLIKELTINDMEICEIIQMKDSLEDAFIKLINKGGKNDSTN